MSRARVLGKDVRERLLRLISEGEFSETGVLPAEQTLARMLGVSRTPLRAVIEELIDQGIIKRNGKRGCVLQGKGMKLSSPLSDAVIFISDYIKPSETSEVGDQRSMQSGIAAKTLSKGYNLLVIQNVKTLALKSSVNWFLGNPPLAVMPSNYISHNHENADALERLRKSGIHVIVSGNAPFLKKFNRVSTDQEKGAYLLTRHLLGRGCRDIRILNFKDSGSYWMSERLKGYRKAMMEAELKEKDIFPGIDVPLEFRGKSNSSDYIRWLTGALAPELLQEKPPEALMVYSDAYCEVIGKALDTLMNGRPDRPLVAGFDGFWEQIETKENKKYRPVATVNAQPYRQGEMMVEMLEDEIAGKLDKPEVRFCEPELVVYESMSK